MVPQAWLVTRLKRLAGELRIRSGFLLCYSVGRTLLQDCLSRVCSHYLFAFVPDLSCVVWFSFKWDVAVSFSCFWHCSLSASPLFRWLPQSAVSWCRVKHLFFHPGPSG